LPPENALWPDVAWSHGNRASNAGTGGNGAVRSTDNVVGMALGKAACTFKVVDITRIFKAAKKAGVDVQVEIDLERKRMTITPVRRDGENSARKGTAVGEGEWDNIQ
jgi:hypothetical protein